MVTKKKEPLKSYLTCPVCSQEKIEGKGFPNHMGKHNWTREQTDREFFRQTGRWPSSAKSRNYEQIAYQPRPNHTDLPPMELEETETTGRTVAEEYWYRRGLLEGEFRAKK